MKQHRCYLTNVTVYCCCIVLVYFIMIYSKYVSMVIWATGWSINSERGCLILFSSSTKTPTTTDHKNKFETLLMLDSERFWNLFVHLLKTKSKKEYVRVCVDVDILFSSWLVINILRFKNLLFLKLHSCAFGSTQRDVFICVDRIKKRPWNNQSALKSRPNARKNKKEERKKN